MTTLALDTYAAVKKLQAAGFTEQQAQAQTALLTELVESELATKRDIEALRSELKRDLKELDLRFEARLTETKADIIRWTIGAGIFQTALIAALLLRLVH
jgi:hypothetical protein